MSLLITERSPNSYDEVIHVQPSREELTKATTYITHAVAANKLLNREEEKTFNDAITVSRRAIGYINSYDDETKKLIIDMQEFLNTLFETPKFQKQTKSKVAQIAEQVFLEEYQQKVKIPRSAPIKIASQKMHDDSPLNSFTPKSEGFCIVSCSPPVRKNPPIYSPVCGSPMSQSSVFALFMTPAFPWSSSDQTLSKEVSIIIE